MHKANIDEQKYIINIEHVELVLTRKKKLQSGAMTCQRTKVLL